MKTEKEIKERKLKLYDSREKFKKYVGDAKNESPLDTALHAALDTATSVYTSMIAELNWVLESE